MRKIITGFITAGGVLIFVTVMGILCAIKKAKMHFRTNGNHRGKIMVEPSHTTGGKH